RKSGGAASHADGASARTGAAAAGARPVLCTEGEAAAGAGAEGGAGPGWAAVTGAVTTYTTSAVRWPGPMTRSQIDVRSPNHTTMLVTPVAVWGWRTRSWTSCPRLTVVAVPTRGSPS